MYVLFLPPDIKKLIFLKNIVHLVPVFSSSISRGEPNENGSGSVFESKEQLRKILTIL